MMGMALLLGSSLRILQASCPSMIRISLSMIHAMSTDREKAMDAGCDAYETKPVELPRLLAAIEKLLPGS